MIGAFLAVVYGTKPGFVSMMMMTTMMTDVLRPLFSFVHMVG